VGSSVTLLGLANGQPIAATNVGIIADRLTGGERAEAAFKEIAPRLKLGVHRLAIRREPFPADILVWVHFMRLIRRLKPQVLHGHGAKAGAFRSPETAFERRHSRLYAAWRLAALSPLNTVKGALLQRLERALMNSTDLFLFEAPSRAIPISALSACRPGWYVACSMRNRGRVRCRNQGG